MVLLQDLAAAGYRFTTIFLFISAGVNPAIATGPADFRNNVVYNFRDGFSHEGHPPKPPFSIVGNYYKRGPSDPKIFPFCFAGKTPYYLRDNYIEGVGIIQNPWAEADKLYG